MALLLTLVVVLTCFGGLASPGPVPPSTVLRELIEELDNITQKASLCNGSMVWSVNLTASRVSSLGPLYCAALESLVNVSDCRAIQRTQRLLRALCPKPSAMASSPPAWNTKVEAIRFARDLLQQLRKAMRRGWLP